MVTIMYGSIFLLGFEATSSVTSTTTSTLLLLLWLTVPVSLSCTCTTRFSGGSINCSSQNLHNIPEFPAETTELHLQGNLLRTVTPGRLDTLRSLRLLDVSSNPLHCGCNIHYLRLWLLRNPGAVRAPPTCGSPPALARRPLVGLSEDEFSDCVSVRCPGAGFNLGVSAALAVLVLMLVWCLRLAKGLSFTLGIGDRHTGLEVETLRSLRPKHRLKRKRSLGYGHGELERPLLDMDILPQIIDTLDRKHNIKFKET